MNEHVEVETFYDDDKKHYRHNIIIDKYIDFMNKNLNNKQHMNEIIVISVYTRLCT